MIQHLDTVYNKAYGKRRERVFPQETYLFCVYENLECQDSHGKQKKKRSEYLRTIILGSLQVFVSSHQGRFLWFGHCVPFSFGNILLEIVQTQWGSV